MLTFVKVKDFSVPPHVDTPGENAIIMFLIVLTANKQELRFCYVYLTDLSHPVGLLNANGFKHKVILKVWNTETGWF